MVYCFITQNIPTVSTLGLRHVVVISLLLSHYPGYSDYSELWGSDMLLSLILKTGRWSTASLLRIFFWLFWGLGLRVVINPQNQVGGLLLHYPGYSVCSELWGSDSSKPGRWSTASLPRIFCLFRALGLRLVVIINPQNQLGGLLSHYPGYSNCSELWGSDMLLSLILKTR